MVSNDYVFMAVNAIDFSDLTKKSKPQVKPQGFQTPPPQPPQTQMGIKKSDGTVEPAMGYPVNQMGQGAVSYTHLTLPTIYSV